MIKVVVIYNGWSLDSSLVFEVVWLYVGISQQHNSSSTQKDINQKKKRIFFPYQFHRWMLETTRREEGKNSIRIFIDKKQYNISSSMI